MQDILEDIICGYTKGQVLCFTLDPRMVTLPQVDEDQEEVVWSVLEIRCVEMYTCSNTTLGRNRKNRWFCFFIFKTPPLFFDYIFFRPNMCV
jgi:hypothetical protein